MGNIEWDPDWENKLKQAAAPAMAKLIEKKQSDLDALLERSQGKTAEQIAPDLKQVWEEDGGEISDPELTKYATVLASGERVVLLQGE